MTPRQPIPMSETVDNLILDLLEWIGQGERPYLETMEAWRTSCPPGRTRRIWGSSSAAMSRVGAPSYQCRPLEQSI